MPSAPDVAVLLSDVCYSTVKMKGGCLLFVDHSDGDIFPLRVIRILDIRGCDNTPPPGYFKIDIFPCRYVV